MDVSESMHVSQSKDDALARVASLALSPIPTHALAQDHALAGAHSVSESPKILGTSECLPHASEAKFLYAVVFVVSQHKNHGGTARGLRELHANSTCTAARHLDVHCNLNAI